MKKFLSLILVITMFITLACGCNKDDEDPTLSGGGSNSAKQGRLLKKYIDINKTGKYRIQTIIKTDQVEIPVSVGVCDKDKKLITFDISSKNPTTKEDIKLPITYINKSETSYLLVSGYNTYGKIDDSKVPFFNMLLKGAYLQLNSLSYVNDGTATVKGKECEYEDYMNIKTNKYIRFVFEDKKLIMQAAVSEDGELLDDYKKCEMSGDINAEMFNVPDNYTLDQKSIDKLLEILGVEASKVQ